MITFRNRGLIDLDAVRVMGVSVKEAGSFGRFGTGIKYGIATALRGGGSITIFRDGIEHKLGTRKKVIRGDTFEIVTLDNKNLGFTTSLGVDWEPWMVLREFGCNARDEGGDFFSPEDGTVTKKNLKGGTIIQIEWEALDLAYLNRKDLFLEGDELLKTETLRVVESTSSHLFYRGVRVYQLDKPSKYRYDILAEQQLTEDRTLIGPYSAQRIIADAILQCTNKDILTNTLSCTEKDFEYGLNFDRESWQAVSSPTREFLDAVITLREDGKPVNPSARKLLMKHQRTESYAAGGSYRRIVDDAFNFAIECLDGLGIAFEDDQQFITVDELPGDTKSMAENGRIYLLSALLREDARVISFELLKRYVDLQDFYTADKVTEFLGMLLIDKDSRLSRFAKMVAEDAANAEAVGEAA